MNRYSVDLNCDLGESFGAYTIGQDELMLDFVTSANIACGFHGGDPMVMQKTVKLALAKNVAIGAHPGLPDLAGFGRRDMAISSAEAFTMVVYQIGALGAFVRAEGGVLHHVKPHGALYNMAAVNTRLAEAISEAIYKVNPDLILYGLAGTELIKAGKRLGLKTAQEVFADRTYQSDGTLTPRHLPQAFVTNPTDAAAQVIRMVKEGKVRSQQKEDIDIVAETICLHGDNLHALRFARHLHAVLMQEKVLLKAK